MGVNKYLSVINDNKFLRHFFERLRYASFSKLINFIKAEIALHDKRTSLPSYPYEAILDLNNYCNLKCPLCDTGMSLSKYPKGTMGLPLFSEICRQLSPYVFNISLYNYGEIFLVKQLEKYFRVARKNRIGLTLSSNLSMHLSDETIENLIKYKINTLIISCDGTTQEAYEKYRKKGDINVVFQNIKRISLFKKRLKSRFPTLVWQFLVMKHNKHEVEQAKSTYKKIGADRLEFGPITIPFGIRDDGLVKTFFTEEQQQTRKSWYVLQSDMHVPCWWLWRAIVVNWDGTVVPCCNLNCDDYGFGDFKTHSLNEIWNSKAYVSARKLSLGKSTQMDLICKQCDVIKAYPEP